MSPCTKPPWHCLLLSASQGDIPALRNLAGYYQGVTNRDIKEAFRLYLLAESKGDKKSSQDLFALRESYT
ncbi:hypothetical protein Pelo_18881 [Pelomyxa schiedti]|nr:hypothetical protein Pelo_18881 [Pelomyxa schiedti]